MLEVMRSLAKHTVKITWPKALTRGRRLGSRLAIVLLGVLWPLPDLGRAMPSSTRAWTFSTDDKVGGQHACADRAVPEPVLSKSCTASR